MVDEELVELSRGLYGGLSYAAFQGVDVIGATLGRR